MPDASPSIWGKVNFDLARPTTATTNAKLPPEELARNRRRLKRRVRVLDSIATFFWVYALVKVFITDLDRTLAQRISPSLEFLVDFRFFVFLGALSLLVLAFRKKLVAVVAFVYIALFPLVVLFWKIPRTLYRTKSWVAAFAVINAASSVLSDLRYSVVFVTLTAFSVLGILAGDADSIIGISVLVLFALLLVSIGRTIWFSLAPSRFLDMQQQTITRIVESEPLKQMTSVGDDLRRADVEKFSPQQQEMFVQQLTHGVIAYHGLLYWAYQLEQYRLSPASLLYSTLAYISLFLRVVVALALMNYGLYRIDGNAYEYVADPSVWVFVRYSMTGLYGGEIEALRPISDLANVTSIAALCWVPSSLPH